MDMATPCFQSRRRVAPVAGDQVHGANGGVRATAGTQNGFTGFAFGCGRVYVRPVKLCCAECAPSGAAHGVLTHLALDARFIGCATKNRVVCSRSCGKWKLGT
eukprot:6951201-Prymnesium_polylepis.1